MPDLALDGFVVAVTAERRAGEQIDLLRRRGARVLHHPVITTDFLDRDDGLRAATAAVIRERPDLLVCTTGVGVRAWFDAARAWNLEGALLDSLVGAGVVARGPKAAAAARAAGLEVSQVATGEHTPDIIRRLGAWAESSALPGTVVALQSHGDDDTRIRSALEAAGHSVIEVRSYRARPSADSRSVRGLIEVVAARQVHAVTFTSSSAVRALFAAADRAGRSDVLLAGFGDGVAAACIGPVCAATARELGVAQPLHPVRGRLGLLVRVVTDHLSARTLAFRFGGNDVAVRGFVLDVGGTRSELAPRERAVLGALVDRRGAVLPAASLALGAAQGRSRSRGVEATIARLRRKLGPAAGAVATVRRRGYRFAGTLLAQQDASGSPAREEIASP